MEELAEAPCGTKQCIDEYVEQYEVRIETLEAGYVLAVGCKRFAITDKAILLNMLTRYFNNPAQLQKEFKNKTLIIK